MKISIFTTITNPDYWQYAWKEALDCYGAFADEVIVVDGKDDWPYEWHWSELPKHIQKGFEQCTGDVAIKMDIDYLLHDIDFDRLKLHLIDFWESDLKVAAGVKLTILNKNKGYQKARLPIIVNMKYKDEIAWGIDDTRKTDWCFPILKEYQDEFAVWHGKTINPVYDTGINIYNYDYFFRTEEKAKEAFWRFSKAWNRATGDWSWGKTEEEALEVFKKQLYGRLKNQYLLDIKQHPKFISERIKNLKPEELGYKNWL